MNVYLLFFIYFACFLSLNFGYENALSGSVFRTTRINRSYFRTSLQSWGTSRFESTRPVSLQPDSINLSRVSAESSSESEAQSISSVSGVKGSKSKEDRRSGVFRIFGRKGGDKEKEKDKDKRRSSQTPQ
ncbi:hypothetical protein FF38_09916 [Lucilia cuprina]|uniref:Uncharacterized protein n=1 Tax=Lucilia cuprina TaxID=7375 RepID=A0A0L0CC35_LUCCU|nr:hypothetical protein FF38_09916 [Lucilia cuprina]